MLQLSGHHGTVHALAVGERGNLVSAGRDRTIRVWDLSSGSERTRLEAHESPILSLALHPAGRALASGAADGWLKLWDLTTGQVVQSSRQMAAITGLAWLTGRTSLLMACGERLRPDRPGELCLWNFENKPPLTRMRIEDQGFWSLAVARASSTVAWSGGNRSVSAWDITQQRPRSFRQAAAGLVVALSPDGKLLASSSDRVIKIWDIESNRERQTLDGHRGLVRALSFSPDGSTLASGGQDSTVRLWNALDGTPGPIYDWPIGAVHSLTFSLDGMTAAAAGDAGTIWVWDMGD